MIEIFIVGSMVFLLVLMGIFSREFGKVSYELKRRDMNEKI